jgi:hypothetical protein
MPDEAQNSKRMPRRFRFLRVPLFRPLATNLAAATGGVKIMYLVPQRHT